MTHEELLIQLEELASRLNIEVRYESARSEDPATFGGYCRNGERHIIITHSKASTRRKIDVFTEALSHFDIDDLYLRPALRDHLKKSKDKAADPLFQGM
jgi:hypothetical protein